MSHQPIVSPARATFSFIKKKSIAPTAIEMHSLIAAGMSAASRGPIIAMLRRRLIPQLSRRRFVFKHQLVSARAGMSGTVSSSNSLL